MARLRVGIIGGGTIARAHLPRLRERSDAVEITAVADVNEAAGAALANEFGIRHVVTDYRQLLPRVDAVLICVPTHRHAEIAIESLRAGKTVFCEKPLARTMEQALAIAKAAKEPRFRFQIGFVRRFDSQWLALRDSIQQNKIGRPVVWRDCQSGPGIPIPWFCTDEQGGGPFLDGCVHNYDFALHIFGPAEWVFAHLRTLNPQNTALDSGTATIHFATGDELLLSWTWGLPAGSPYFRRLDVLGPRGSITFADDGKPVIHRGGEDIQILAVEPHSLTRGFADQMDEYLEVAQGRRQPRAGINEGLASLQLALAVLESGRRGGEKIFLTESA